MIGIAQEIPDSAAQDQDPKPLPGTVQDVPRLWEGQQLLTEDLGPADLRRGPHLQVQHRGREEGHPPHEEALLPR